MRILLTGATGTIGSSLLRRLSAHHELFALIRKQTPLPEGIHSIRADLLDESSLQAIPEEIDIAYYLVHSMSDSSSRFHEMEKQSALHFQKRIAQTKAKQIIYLSGLSNEEDLSKHLQSRKHVDEILRKGPIPVTTLMAGIILSSSSASYEIIRDLVERLPIMTAPKWIEQKVQPIALSDVLDYLTLVINHPACLEQRFEIGGPDVVTYKELLLAYAREKNLKRWILTIPVLTPRLSAYWLWLVTNVPFALASALIHSVKNNAICKEHRIRDLFPKKLLSLHEALQEAIHEEHAKN